MASNNQFRISLVNHLRSAYSKFFRPSPVYYTDGSIKEKDAIQKIVADGIYSGRPFMAARIGSIELEVCENLKYSLYHKRSNLKYIQWKGQPNFINTDLMCRFANNAGFFPSDDVTALKCFYDLMVECMPKVDVLGSWLYNEADFKKELASSVKVDRELMTPLLTETPWTRALKGKKVLVIHPFEDTIKAQYARREKLFPRCPDILPEFELHTIKAVQSIGQADERFKDWFDALDYMKRQMDAVDYDVCLLGCGAYGFPLAAYAKDCGKQAIHLGGVLQLLFGIKGKRWETDEGYIKIHPYASTYYNEYWIRPDETEKPQKADGVEGGCYW